MTPIDELNNVFKIVFENITVKESVEFKAFITNWNDEFKQDWQSHSTFGRMDDIRIFKRTSRKINFDIEIPSVSEKEADKNFANIQKLIQMSYPTFEVNKLYVPNSSDSSQPSNPNTAATANAEAGILAANQSKSNSYEISIMGSPPFMNIKFANWALEPGNFLGLYGTIDAVKFNPSFGAEGGFYSARIYSFTEQQTYAPLTPKLLKLSILFNVIHVENLGYQINKDQSKPTLRQSQFPYRAEEVYDRKKSLYETQERTAQGSLIAPFNTSTPLK